ncbi:hypothetical protein CsSME_00014244 [Camellia sinensis var. sinensis]
MILLLVSFLVGRLSLSPLPPFCIFIFVVEPLHCCRSCHMTQP